MLQQQGKFSEKQSAIVSETFCLTNASIYPISVYIHVISVYIHVISVYM